VHPLYEVGIVVYETLRDLVDRILDEPSFDFFEPAGDLFLVHRPPPWWHGLGWPSGSRA
jgi:hypothetical protein